MSRRIGVVASSLVAMALAGCAASSGAPLPSVPTAPAPPPGWTSIASGGTGGVGGFDGFQVAVSGRPTAISVACPGHGWLTVGYAAGPDDGTIPATGLDAAVFRCGTDLGVQRRELGTSLGAGTVSITGGVVPGPGDAGPHAWVVSLEEQLP